MERLPWSVMSASNSGKCDTTVSSRSSRPSAAAKAAAVDVKDLLSEYSRCGRSGAVWMPPAFGDDVPVSQQHEAVHLDIWSGIQGIEEREHAGWVDLLLEGRAPRQ